jgi:succinate dehydrogenase / fumarate reductase cytochrome b subunit
MNFLLELYTSTVGKKFLMAFTGLFLCLYLVVHVSGNLLLFKQDGGVAFDTYAEILPSIFIIRIIEIVLFLVFIGHIFTGTVLWIRNKRARPIQYEEFQANENSSLSSRTMFLTGSIVFIFLVIHLRSFYFPSRFAHEINPSMYALVKTAFSSPVYSLFYVFAMALLGFHLRHGFQSAFQSFGIKHTKYAALIEAVAVLFWLIIPILFASMPIYFLLNS